MLGHHLARRRSLKALASMIENRGLSFSGLAAFKLQAMGRLKASKFDPNLAAGFNPQVYISILQARRAAG